MRNLDNATIDNDRIVVKQRSTKYVGVETRKLTRNAIGYVLRGEKYIQQDDRTIRVNTGDIFFMGLGSHLIENVPTPTAPFEQIVFYYSPVQIQQVLASLDEDLIETLSANKEMKRESYVNVAAEKPSKITQNFFIGANTHYECRGFIEDHLSESLKLTELIHYILKYEQGDMQNLLISSLDSERANFERIIYNNILCDKSIDELARECRRSTTSFKKEFKDIFNTPPHQWYLRQRLNYARLLLNTTNHTISQIGIICTFPNTSHFIKLFKRRFGYTPATYRNVAKNSVVENIKILQDEDELAVAERKEA